MKESTEVAEKLLGFYYCAYNKLVSYPFLYSELIPDRFACDDESTTDQECLCCAIRIQDLKNAFAIFEGRSSQNAKFHLQKCKEERAPGNRYFRIAAVSLDIDATLKSPEFFPAQLYIVCVLLEMQKLKGKLNSNCNSSKLVPFFTKYVYETKSRQGTNIQEEMQENLIGQEEYADFLRHLCVEQYHLKNDNLSETSEPMELLDEAIYKFIQLHANKVGFYSTFSKIMCCVSSEDKKGFSYDN